MGSSRGGERMVTTALMVAWMAAPGAARGAFTPGEEPQRLGQELLAKAVEAFGGAAAVDAVGALEVKSKGTRRVQGSDLEVITITRYFFPDRYYQELQLPMGVMKTVLSPKEAFIVAGEGSLALPDSERQTLLKLMQRNLVAILKARKQPGVSTVPAGNATVGGKAAALVAVKRDGDTVTLAIDTATGQVLQSSYTMPAAGLTQAGELVINYSDYQRGAPGQLVYPFTAVGTMAGEPAFAQHVESVVVNPKLDETLFQPPPPHTMFPGADEPPPPKPKE